MSKRQKVLMVFGILQIIGAVSSVGIAILDGDPSSWVDVIIFGISAYLVLAAARDASKIMGAWIILLVVVIRSALSLVRTIVGDGVLVIANGGVLAVTGGGNGIVIAIGAVDLALSLFAFIAANNVKKQAGK